MILVYGTASSGKSNIAENMAVDHSKKSDTSLVYIATMENESDAAKERIKRHREQREGKGFYTIEEMYNLAVHDLSVLNKTVLIECMSNLCANIYYKEFGDAIVNDSNIKRATDYIVNGLVKLSKTASEVIIVSNDVFSDGRAYDKWTERYMKFLADVNSEIAKMSNEFYEVINGIPVLIKKGNKINEVF